GHLRDVEDLVDRQVGGDRRLALADQVGLVRLVPVLVMPLLLAVDRDGADAEFAACPEHPDRDLTAVGAQDLAEGGRVHGARLWRRTGAMLASFSTTLTDRGRPSSLLGGWATRAVRRLFSHLRNPCKSIPFARS